MDIDFIEIMMQHCFHLMKLNWPKFLEYVFDYVKMSRPGDLGGHMIIGDMELMLSYWCKNCYK